MRNLEQSVKCLMIAGVVGLMPGIGNHTISHK